MKKLSIDDLKPGLQLSRPVKDADGEVLLDSCLIINSDNIQLMRDNEITEVYVLENQDLEEKAKVWGDILEKGFAQTRKSTLEASSRFLKKVARGEREDESEEETSLLEIMNKILDDGNVLLKLSGVNAVDNYLYSHSVNTAVLAMLIAMKENLDADVLHDVGKAALMADVGMLLIPASTWEHKGALTEEQRNAVQKHVEYSRDIINDIPTMNEELAEVVYQHHERCDGSGYPRKLKGDDIHLAARLLAVADVFSAIREPRIYREQAGPVRALKAITKSHGFDPGILRRFLATISVYPVQTIVRLNDNSIGRVVSIHENNPFRPVVDIIRDEAGAEIPTDEEHKINLAAEENMHLYIEEALDDLPEDGE